MSQNNCISVKWVSQAVMVKPESASSQNIPTSGTVNLNFNTGTTVLQGVQSVGYDTNHQLDKVFQLGQSQIYYTNEDQVNITGNIERALDGTCPAFLAATMDAPSPTLLGREGCRFTVGVSYFPCTVDSATGQPDVITAIVNANINSLGYTINTEGFSSESLGFQANDILSLRTADIPVTALQNYPNCTFTASFVADASTLAFSGTNSGNDQSPNCTTTNRQDIIFTPTVGSNPATIATAVETDPTFLDENSALRDPDVTILPPQVVGIDSDGVNRSDVCISNISITADLAREEIFCLGRRSPASRTLTLPVTVSTSIETISPVGPLVSATDQGICLPVSGCTQVGASGVTDFGNSACSQNGINSPTATIRLATCQGLRIYLGTRNQLVSSNTTGGSTGGEDLSVTYNFESDNVFTVVHSNDCSPSGGDWWNNRATYLLGTAQA